MNGPELIRIVDAIHRDKNIDKEIVFEGIEQALLSAAHKHYGEEAELVVTINREDGQISVKLDAEELDPDILGRIAAQSAKQVMIQKIREAERDALFDEFSEMKGQIVSGSVSRIESGAANVSLGKVEGLLPRSEQIPGEYHRVGERVRAVVLDVRKQGSRVKIILSRTHPDLVRQLFEVEIPEIADRVIEVRSLAREAGYRSKVAVSCFDSKIDCVGACVGVRGSRIRSIVDELAGERIDIVRWNDSLQVLVPNALQPAEVEDVILCPRLGKVIVLVRDDQLSLSIGKKGQNVRLASKLVGWDIHVMTQEKLDVQLEESVAAFSEVPHITDELAETLVSHGFFTFDDLSVIEPDQLAELGGLTSEQCDTIVAHADVESERIEKEEAIARQEARLARQAEAAEAAAAAKRASEEGSEASEADAEAATETESETAAGEGPQSGEEETGESSEDGSEASEADAEAAAETEGETVAAAAAEEPQSAEEDAGESEVAEAGDEDAGSVEGAATDDTEQPTEDVSESPAAEGEGETAAEPTNGNSVDGRTAVETEPKQVSDDGGDETLSKAEASSGEE